jgi:hypothetical protein
VTDHGGSCHVESHKTNGKRYIEQEKPIAKKIVNIRLRPDQEERINAIVERSAILDVSKFVPIAIDCEDDENSGDKAREYQRR